MAESDCPSYQFKAKLLLDSSSLFSLELQRTRMWACLGRTDDGDERPLLFDMTTGREYDIGELYRLREPSGALAAPLRKLAVLQLALQLREMPSSVVAKDVEDDLSRRPPKLFVTKTGVRVWPEGTRAWLGDVQFTWAELRPYLNKMEARRLGWDQP
jgi:hypothetical protein